MSMKLKLIFAAIGLLGLVAVVVLSMMTRTRDTADLARLEEVYRQLEQDGIASLPGGFTVSTPDAVSVNRESQTLWLRSPKGERQVVIRQQIGDMTRQMRANRAMITPASADVLDMIVYDAEATEGDHRLRSEKLHIRLDYRASAAKERTREQQLDAYTAKLRSAVAEGKPLQSELDAVVFVNAPTPEEKQIDSGRQLVLSGSFRLQVLRGGAVHRKLTAGGATIEIRWKPAAGSPMALVEATDVTISDAQGGQLGQEDELTIPITEPQ
ncbi:MAG: hypothetical protein ACLFVU_01650 [Phycisphaerae bacterium]